MDEDPGLEVSGETIGIRDVVLVREQDLREPAFLLEGAQERLYGARRVHQQVAVRALHEVGVGAEGIARRVAAVEDAVLQELWEEPFGLRLLADHADRRRRAREQRARMASFCSSGLAGWRITTAWSSASPNIQGAHCRDTTPPSLGHERGE